MSSSRDGGGGEGGVMKVVSSSSSFSAAANATARVNHNIPKQSLSSRREADIMLTHHSSSKHGNIQVVSPFRQSKRQLVPESSGNEGASPSKNKTLLNNAQTIVLPFSVSGDGGGGGGTGENAITTSKYNLVNFFPKVLFLQYRKFGNVYFTVLVVLMLLGKKTDLFESPLSPTGTLTTLLGIFTLNFILEAKDDIKRHRDDNKTNCQTCDVVEDGKTVPVEWGNLRPGNLIVIRDYDEVPADVVIVATSTPSARCYTETSSIDGETNLKIRQSCAMSSNLGIVDGSFTADVARAVSSIAGRLYYENPSAILRFTGRFESDSKLIGGPKIPTTVAIDFDNVLLRGSVLRNTAWVIGLVVYCGHDTKVLRSQKKAPSKQSKIDRLVNKIIFYVILIDIVAVVSSVAMLLSGASAWENSRSENLWYMKYSDMATEYKFPPWLANGFTFAILYKNILPIMMYFIQEVANFVQSWLIEQDLRMYHERTNTPAVCRANNLLQELGQVEYVFSDKTGTLTQNEMRLVACSVGGTRYGLVTSGIEESFPEHESYTTGEKRSSIGSKSARSGSTRSFSSGASNESGRSGLTPRATLGAIAGVAMKARTMIKRVTSPNLKKQHQRQRSRSRRSLKKEDRATDINFRGFLNQLYSSSPSIASQQRLLQRFVEALSLCHTVIVDTKKGQYSAESPDEEALVNAACDMGYRFTGAQSSASLSSNEKCVGLRIKGRSSDDIYRVLAVNQFSSKRKCMSIVVKCPNGKIRVIVKGADDVVLSRAARGYDASRIAEDLLVFSVQGLRTLVVAEREISGEEYLKWSRQYQSASGSIGDQRKNALEAAAASIETNLTILGCTAIEDKLQVGVPSTIRTLKEAGINLWVLTGDKVETAVNIGYSSNILTADESKMSILFATSPSREDCVEVLHQVIQQAGNVKKQSIHRQPSDNVRVLTHKDESAGSKGASVQETESVKKIALVLSGKAVQCLLAGEEGTKGTQSLLLRAARRCSTVVACRVSPAQKAMLVHMVQKGITPAPTTLAIGDGANDVGMIQAARVGIGISGNEGRHAVNSSDFAIAQFRYLKYLLLVHGRFNYIRIAKAVGHIIYANLMFTFVSWAYNFYCGFSGQPPYGWQWYTIWNYIVGVPTLCIALLDRDVNPVTAIRVPALYGVGRENVLLSKRMFIAHGVRALVHAGIALTLTVFVPSIGSPFGESIVALGSLLYLSQAAVLVVRTAEQSSLWSFWFILALAVSAFGSVGFVASVNLQYEKDSIVLREPYFAVFVLTGLWAAATSFAVDTAARHSEEVLVPVSHARSYYVHSMNIEAEMKRRKMSWYNPGYRAKSFYLDQISQSASPLNRQHTSNTLAVPDMAIELPPLVSVRSSPHRISVV